MSRSKTLAEVLQSKSCILIRVSKKDSSGWRSIWFREEFGCLLRYTSWCNLWSQALVFVPSAFHSIWHQGASYLRSFLSCPTESRLQSSKVRRSASVSELIKAPCERRAFGQMACLIHFLNQCLCLWRREGRYRYMSLGACICLYARVYKQRQHGTQDPHCLQKRFASHEYLGIRFVGDLHSLLMGDSFTNTEMGFKRSLQCDLVSFFP